VAILRLVDQDRLSLDTRVFPLLGELPPPAKRPARPAPGLHHVAEPAAACRQLEQQHQLRPAGHALDLHRGGRVGHPGAPSPRDIVRFVRGQPLDFDPGRATAYSNFGYNMLGR
jgi:N-acyl-D-amino-acid deacylase